ncbi:hypothetical protein WDU94_001723 [Cyamophila willieti]
MLDASSCDWSVATTSRYYSPVGPAPMRMPPDPNPYYTSYGTQARNHHGMGGYPVPPLPMSCPHPGPPRGYVPHPHMVPPSHSGQGMHSMISSSSSSHSGMYAPNTALMESFISSRFSCRISKV